MLRAHVGQHNVPHSPWDLLQHCLDLTSQGHRAVDLGSNKGLSLPGKALQNELIGSEHCEESIPTNLHAKDLLKTVKDGFETGKGNQRSDRWTRTDAFGPDKPGIL